MPSLLSKFKGSSANNSTPELNRPAGHRRAHTTANDHSAASSIASAGSNPRLILTSVDNDSLESSPLSPGSLHRIDSMAAPASNEAHQRHTNTLYANDDEGRARKLFADRIKEGNKHALSAGTSIEGQDPAAEADDLTPGPRRAPPSRDLPPEPPRSQPSLPFTTTTPDRRSASQSRSRHNSTVSSPPSEPSVYSQLPLVSSPTDDAHSIPASPPQAKKSWRRRDSQSSQKSTKSKPSPGPVRRAHPSGGLASAIAGSGLALVNPAVHRPIIPPVPAMPVTTQASRHRHNSSVSEIPLNLNPGIDRHAASRKSSMTYSNGGGEILMTETRHKQGHADSSGSEGSEEEDESSPDEDPLLTEYAAPITGFAVASSRRTADFHALFPTVPEGDYLIEDYGCALQREILIQGRLYISENHVCFHANIFGWTTDLVIPIENITHIQKRMTAYVIPNALQISSSSGKYVFASLLSRDTTYDVIYNIWRSLRPDAIPSPRGSIDGVGQSNSIGSLGESLELLAQGGEKPSGGGHNPTMCACAREGKHYSEVAMETVVPGDPEKIYNLMFASGFIKDFMRVDEKLIDIQISDWAPISAASKLLQRNMSYIKPLSGSIGPKQTKCELTDEMVHLDYNEYITMLTTTRTPDVPSGGVFSVRTRTCLTWAGAASTKILVTTQVEWTGRSFIRSIIERSCIDGQKTYHTNLERAMRVYIAAHKSEFIPQGAEVEEVLVNPTATLPPTTDPISSEELRKAKEKERSQRGLQWALDTVEGTAKVAQQSFSGAIELIKDTWESSSMTAVLWFVVVGLVLSNIWTYARAGRKHELGFTRRSVGKKVEEDVQRVVGESVRDAFRVFEEVVRGDGRGVVNDVAELRRRLDSVESKLSVIEGRLDAVD